MIALTNVSHFNKDYQILKNINLKVYAGERVSVVADGINSGRYSLMNLMLMIEKIEAKGNTDTGCLTPLSRVSVSSKNKPSTIELLGENIEFLDKGSFRKRMAYLAESPPVFYGSVRENIDPDGEYEDAEIIKTIHFLKVKFSP